MNADVAKSGSVFKRDGRCSRALGGRERFVLETTKIPADRSKRLQ